jgi:signal transduction histidine kinase
MARRQSADQSPINVNEIINELRGTFAQAATERVAIEFDFAPTPTVARLDSVQLDLVVLNLIRNAAEAMPGGGTVVIRTRVLPAPEATEILGVQDAIELSVTDTGVGMPPGVASRATEAFYTTKDRSVASGLGLFVALSFAEQSGGRLLLETEQGRGTTVRIVVPREKSSEADLTDGGSERRLPSSS